MWGLTFMEVLPIGLVVTLALASAGILRKKMETAEN
jgi:hypothetical protein